MHTRKKIKKKIRSCITIVDGLFRRIHYPAYMRCYLIVNLYITKIRSQKKLSKEWSVAPISSLPINKHKKSETIFILGSGASINTISSSQWEVIKKNDSFGFNNWFYHDHVPTYYAFEATSNNERQMIFHEILHLIKKDYTGIPIIYHGGGNKNRIFDINKLPIELKPNFYISSEIVLNSTDRKELYQELQYLDSRNFFDLQNRINLVFYKRATLSYAIIFSFLAGYKNIVLCGVDLNNIDYFYEKKPETYQQKGLPILKSGQKGTIHRTMDPNAFPNKPTPTIDSIVYAINDVLLKPRKINLYVAFSSSALYPKLPTFFEGISNRL